MSQLPSANGTAVAVAPTPLPPVPSLPVLLNSSFRLFVTNGLLTFNLYAGFTLLLRALVLARKGKVPKLSDLVGESNLVYREIAVLYGLFIGGFWLNLGYLFYCTLVLAGTRRP